MKRMTMKTYIYFIALLLTVTACSNFLDETPKGTLIPKTINDFGMILDSYESGDNKIACGNTLTMAMTDDVKIPSSKVSVYYNWGIRSFCWQDYIFTQNENDEVYNSFYHVIYVCNYILNNIETAEEGGLFKRKYVEGAAHFHRAYAYFNLINLYARHYDAKTSKTDLGVPLLLEADIDLLQKRATVEEVYNCILDDLAAADTLLDNEVEYRFRASKAAVGAFKARVHLYRGEYKACLKACRDTREMIDEPADYNELEKRSGNPDRGIIGLPRYQWEMPDVICYKGEGRHPDYHGDYNLSDDLMILFNKDTDLRWQLFVSTYDYNYGEPDTDEPRIASFVYPNNNGCNIGEVYITEAEAAVRDNDIDGALDMLNALAVKRHVEGTYEDVTERDPEKLLELILKERRREQMFKGTRWFDLKRLNKEERFQKTVVHELNGKTYTLEPNSNRYVLPIPLKAIAANNLLEQNPR